MPSEISHRPRNAVVFVVSLWIALVAVLGTAVADRMPTEPMPQQRQTHVRHKQPAPPKPVRHDTKFHAIPDTQLKIRAVEYDGATNGELTVQVKNTAKTTQAFAATGLYFVPEGDPDKAPQRLGAVGPMQVVAAAGAQGKELSKLEIAPGATVEVVLDVFCIDSHRPSPSPQNRFNVGAKRMPRELAKTIETRADAAVAEERAGGASAPRPAAKGKIQSEVWKSRDAKWIELDGEGKQEATKQR